MLNNKIKESDFLTKQTAEGLRVSINSTLDLSKYLLDIGFHYVLTYKMNQDKLEVLIICNVKMLKNIKKINYFVL